MKAPEKRGEDQKAVSTAMIELTKGDLAGVGSPKIGSKVRVVLQGTLRSLEKAQVDVSQESADVGSLQIEVSSINVQANSDIAELFDEEISD